MVTLGAVKDATGTDAVTSFVEERILDGTDWRLLKARRRWVRLDPPQAYWAVYAIRLGRGEEMPHENGEVVDPEADPPEPRWSEERELRLVARAVFDADVWAAYSQRLEEQFAGRDPDPLNRRGYPVLYPETQHAFWFYPVDPRLTTLALAADQSSVRRLFRSIKREALDRPARINDVQLELVRYLPENNAILRYNILTDPAAASKTVYGKVHHSNRVAETNRVMQALWQLSRHSAGRLNIPRPVGFYPRLGLFLQDSVPGEALGDRTAPEFLPGVIAAAEALATIHDSDIPAGSTVELERHIERLVSVLDQFALVHPRAHFLLRELILHIRNKLRSCPPEQVVPSHGDYKHDQLMHSDGHFSLIDFDYFAYAEPSFDVGAFCSHLIPSMPKGWEHSVAGEEARKAFLDRYRELRPDAALNRFQIYEAVDLASRAMVLMWGQRRGWEPAAEALLALAMERLNSRLP